MIPLLCVQALAVDYTYDALGRLRAESYANGAHVLYTYDVLGNRTKREVLPPNPAPSADLAVTLSLAPNPPVEGAPLTATITVTNNGPDAAPNVAVAPVLPAGFTPRRITASQGAASLADGAQLGLLPAGQSATVTLEGTAQGISALAFNATASSSADTTPGNNSAAASTTPGASADLAITRITVGPNPLTLPTPATYTVEIANLGPSAATGVRLSTTLAEDTTFVSAAPASTETGGVITTALGNLAVGDTVTVTLTVGTAGLAPLAAGRQNSFFCSFTAAAAEADPVNANSRDRPAGPLYRSATLLVTNADNAGPGSLRQAILDANAAPDRDIIAFNIPGGGVPKITPIVNVNDTTKIPLATPMLIDGFTQPGGLVEIDFSLVTSGLAGLEIIGSRDVALRGLVLNRAGTLRPAILIDDTRPGEVRSRDITIQGCRIGTTADGTAAVPNDDGIQIFASDNVLIGGPEPWMGNLISGNAGKGIVAQSNTGLRIQGNRIGVNLAGNAALPNDDGVELGLGGGLLGGGEPGAGNVISGNTGDGVEAGEGAVVQGNVIGLDATGAVAVPNGVSGVRASRGSQIGGFTSAERNVIAGNPSNVIMALDTVGIAGNFIGTDLTGTTAINPTDLGIIAGRGNIGLPVEGGGNLISGCAIGIFSTSSGVVIQNNRIGADITGATALPNVQAGILFRGGTGNLVGGPGLHDGNLISGNTGPGIKAEPPAFGSQFSSSILQGNRIGANLAGGPLGNGGGGIDFDSARDNLIGGLHPGEGNLIAFNTGAGLAIQDASGSTAAFRDAINNRISGNSIHGNTGLGIDLGSDGGVTPNDPLDADNPQDGGNRMQNFPVVTAANAASGLVTGTLASEAGRIYRVELFLNVGADPSGHGEGQTFLGALNLTTDAAGAAGFTFPSPTPLPAGAFVTATATDPDGNTSEFGPARVVESATLIPPVAADDTVHRVRGRAFKVAIADLLANDSARNGGTLTLLAVSSPSAGGVPVLLANGFVTYEPTAEFNASDSFTYTVGNGEGAAQATVTVHVVDFVLGTVAVDAQGTLRVGFSGLPGRRHQLQFTDQLADPIAWQDIGEPQIAPANGSLAFEDTPGEADRFYRVVEMAP